MKEAPSIAGSLTAIRPGIKPSEAWLEALLYFNICLSGQRPRRFGCDQTT